MVHFDNSNRINCQIQESPSKYKPSSSKNEVEVQKNIGPGLTFLTGRPRSGSWLRRQNWRELLGRKKVPITFNVPSPIPSQNALPCCGPSGCAFEASCLHSCCPSHCYHRRRIRQRRDPNPAGLLSPIWKIWKTSPGGFRNFNCWCLCMRFNRRMRSPSLSVSPMRASRPTSSTHPRTLSRPPRRSSSRCTTTWSPWGTISANSGCLD